MVSVGRFQQITPAPAGVLHADHGAWMARLLDHLAEAGARRPALIATDAGFPSDWAVLIRRTYEGWCRQHGIEPQIGEVATDATPEQVDALVRDLIAARPGTDALVCGPDGTAPRALGTLRSMGRRVGEDLLLAAYADGEPAAVRTADHRTGPAAPGVRHRGGRTAAGPPRRPRGCPGGARARDRPRCARARRPQASRSGRRGWRSRRAARPSGSGRRRTARPG